MPDVYKRQDWNDNAPTEPTTEQVTSYRALIIAGPSEKGQELAAKEMCIRDRKKSFAWYKKVIASNGEEL